MKDVLREAGVACAQSTSADSAKEIREFAAQIGFPLILKPRGGAGASGTYKVGNEGELEFAIRESGVENGTSIAVEEFVEGHEGFYDTITVDGKITHDFITHYYPGVLEAMRTRWVSPYFITTNRMDSEHYKEVRDLGQRVNEALGIETSATHMEWFFGPKGLKFSEIGCRPPGVGGWDVYSAANDFDLYKEWAHAIVHGRVDQEPSRQYSCAMIALRPDQDGTVASYEGVDEVMAQYKNEIVTAHFPPPGSPAAGVEGGYMANSWMRVRHADYDELRRILGDISDRIKIRAN
jgi:carbamoylphosphate synthase large subunit